MKEYPELKEVQDYADAMGEKIEVRFLKSDIPGIYNVGVSIGGRIFRGPRFFSFDKKRIFNFWTDYPDKLTPEQIKLFNKYNPLLAKMRDYGGYPPDDEKASDVTKDSAIKSPWDTRF